MSSVVVGPTSTVFRDGRRTGSTGFRRDAPPVKRYLIAFEKSTQGWHIITATPCNFWRSCPGLSNNDAVSS